MGLPTLEFSDSFLDGPEFRGRLQRHEEELSRSNNLIKDIITEGHTLIAALKTLSLAVQRFSRSLQEFQFECIGDAETDDEINIAQSLKEFSQLLSAMEEERKRLIQNADDVLISPLERFRKEQIGAVKEGKKQFEKETERYYSVLEKHLSLSSKKKEAQLNEADSQMARDRQAFFDASLQYVFKIQEVQERKKFEFVEPLLSFLQGLFTFYHEGYELASEFEPYKQQLQFNLQNARNNFESTRAEVERLMKRIRSAEEDFKAPSPFTMEGYLYVQEKRPLGSVWTRYYCSYEKSSKTFSMSNTEVRAANRQNGVLTATPETFKLRSCVRRKTDSIDKRFCFDIEVVERHGVVTLQALSEANRRLWMEAMDGKEPIYTLPSLLSKKEETFLNEVGFSFVRKCISLVESRGLTVLGLYRTAGVNSRVQRLMTSVFASSASSDLLDLDSWDSKTITSALKDYFRCLAEPVLTFRLHKDFIKAAKQEEQQDRVRAVHALVHRLPEKNRSMLELLTYHLHRVSAHSEQNLMGVSNLAMIFGPTLMRSQEETVAAMMDIKFQNIVMEILIGHAPQIFGSAPDLSVPVPQAPPSRSAPRRTKAICLSGKRRARLYPPTLCLADNHSDTSISSSSSTPMGSRESLSSHSSEKNAVPLTSSSCTSSHNTATGSSSNNTQASPPSVSSPPHSSNGTDGTSSSGLPPPSPKTSSSLVTPSSSSSLAPPPPSSSSPLFAVEKSVRGRSAPPESRPPPTSSSSVASPSSSSSLVRPPSSSLAPPPTSSPAVKKTSLERVFTERGSFSSNSSSLDPRSSSSSTITEQQEAGRRRTSSSCSSCSSSSSSSPSRCPSRLSSSSSLTSLHISEDYQSCHGSFQSLMSLKDKPPSFELLRRCAGRNGEQRAEETSSVPQRESSVFSSALDLCSGREAKALYSCEAEHSHELSFPQGALFTNVYPSVEPGWLQATFNGRTGLIPENYIAYV